MNCVLAANKSLTGWDEVSETIQGCVFIGELHSWETSDSQPFPLFHSFHWSLPKVAECWSSGLSWWRCLCFQSFLARAWEASVGSFSVWATERWGVSLRGPLGVNAWPVDVHINLNGGIKWHVGDLDCLLKLTVTCYITLWLQIRSSGALSRLLRGGFCMNRWMISRDMLTLTHQHQALGSATWC